MHIVKLFPRFVLFLLLTATVVFAQDDPSATPTPAPQDDAVQSPQPSDTPTPTPSPAASPVVTKIIPRLIQMSGHLELDDILEEMKAEQANKAESKTTRRRKNG